MTIPPLRYPRDMTGYGATPPDPKWPNQARIAVQIVLNYEEGGENNLLHGDPASEAFLSEISGAEPWPGQRHWNMESIYEYGARAGFWRLHRMLGHLPVTVFGVATALARAPEQVAAMKSTGWEIASHGLKWIEHKDLSEVEERAQMDAAIKLHTEVVGSRPRGWYLGRTSMNSVRMAAEDGGFAYIADSYADDLPYWMRVGKRDQLIVPYTLDANDMRFATAGGFSTGDQFESYLKDSFDQLYAEGGRMLSIGLHCRLAGRPGRAAALKRLIDYIAGHDGVWFATREEIASHWATENPPSRRPLPSQMDASLFFQAFGEVFEQSLWLAERAFGEGIGPTHDTKEGVRSILTQTFRQCSDEERLQVLRAHPDLAVRIEGAAPLSAESAAEQASVGLDALTDEERARFTYLNAEYMDRFGFPFIIAVRDHNKDSIREAFERRLDQTKEVEFAEACRQVERIVELRLDDVMG